MTKNTDDHDSTGNESAESKAFTESIPYQSSREAQLEEVSKGGEAGAEAAERLLKSDDEVELEEAFEEYEATFKETFPDAPDWAIYLASRVDENAEALESVASEVGEDGTKFQTL